MSDHRSEAPDAGRDGAPIYPIGLRLTGRLCVVVGGGPVGARRALGLLRAGARVRLISPELSEELLGLADDGRIEWVARPYRPGDALGGAGPRPALVFAATDSPDVNESICAEAAAAGVPANSAAPPEAGAFALPAVLRRGDVCVAVFTAGDSPGLAGRIRDEVAAHIGPEYGEFAALLRRARAALRSRVADADARRRAMAALVAETGCLELLRAGRRQEAVALLARTADAAIAGGPAAARADAEEEP